MLITCNNCSTSYEIEPCSFGLTGRSVRCIRCGHMWFAANMAALGAIAQIHRAELGLPRQPLIDEPRANPLENSLLEVADGKLQIEPAPPIAAEIDATAWVRPTSVSHSRRTAEAKPTA